MHEPAPLANSTICDGCATNFDCDSGSHGRGSHSGSCHRLVMHVARRGCGVAWQRLTRQRHSSQLLFVIVATQLIAHLAIRHVLAAAPFIRTHTHTATLALRFRPPLNRQRFLSLCHLVCALFSR